MYIYVYICIYVYGENKPADVLVPASAMGTAKAVALDIAITAPTSKTALESHSDTTPLVAATARHKGKLSTHRKALLQAGPAGLAFVKRPLVFETTGAMGKETQKWWESVKQLNRERHEFDPKSRRLRGKQHTWSANSFSTYWLQSIAVAHARTQAESIRQWIGVCQGAP